MIMKKCRCLYHPYNRWGQAPWKISFRTASRLSHRDNCVDVIVDVSATATDDSNSAGRLPANSGSEDLQISSTTAWTVVLHVGHTPGLQASLTFVLNICSLNFSYSYENFYGSMLRIAQTIPSQAVSLSFRLSGRHCHTPVFCRNGKTYHQTFFTIRYGI